MRMVLQMLMQFAYDLRAGNENQVEIFMCDMLPRPWWEF